ncbi:hypothetical protein KBTX_00056 [wastewater metagenome]|uniref:Uncharacterized protein n=2 Tax=unclassified sequences TaxID=12908 RepID=A0A5B8R5K3_9ZZZZ|nr:MULTISPECIES: hypothetical protein [Arhodomonas]MCS4502761.1 hypothetical protein [Arhodomonas aquaeolei]QEA03756.1 hypothetical protein KBTEX_00056 [uncultured organism]
MESPHHLRPRGHGQPLRTPAGAPYHAAAGDVVQLHTGGEWLDVRITAAGRSELAGVVLAAYSTREPARPHTEGGRHSLRFSEDHIWRCVELRR